jgi:hypothetical protein
MSECGKCLLSQPGNVLTVPTFVAHPEEANGPLTAGDWHGPEVFLGLSRRTWAVCFFITALVFVVAIRYRLAQMDGWFIDVFRVEHARSDDAETGRWPGIRFSWPALKRVKPGP